MVKRTDLDPIAEAQARVQLRHRRARTLRNTAKPLGAALQKLARKTVKDKGSALSRIKARWRETAGEEIAKFCRPEKITASKDGRTLTLRVIPAAAPMIQHQSETIRQRVSGAFGGDITKIKLVQGPLFDSGPAPAKPPPPRTLSPQELAALEEQASRIDDPALRRAIVSLGRAVLSREA